MCWQLLHAHAHAARLACDTSPSPLTPLYARSTVSCWRRSPSPLCCFTPVLQTNLLQTTEPQSSKERGWSSMKPIPPEKDVVAHHQRCRESHMMQHRGLHTLCTCTPPRMLLLVMVQRCLVPASLGHVLLSVFAADNTIRRSALARAGLCFHRLDCRAEEATLLEPEGASCALCKTVTCNLHHT